MVDDPSQYTWSSYQINAWGKTADLCTPHGLYLSLAKDESERQKAYRALFKRQIDGKLIKDIRQNVNKGMAVDSDLFKQKNEKLTGRQITERKRGRPIGWKKIKEF